MSRGCPLYPLALLACLALLTPVGLRAADKASKEEKAARQQQQRAEQARRAQEKAAAKQSAKQKDTNNQSVKTQRKTADAFAAEQGKKSDKSEASEQSPTDKELADLDRRLKDEETRHAAAMKGLRKQEQAAAKSRDAKKIEASRLAIAKENETYEKNKASIEDRRREVMERLNPPAKTSDKPAEKPAAPPPGR